MPDVVQELVKDAINVFVYNDSTQSLTLSSIEGR